MSSMDESDRESDENSTSSSDEGDDERENETSGKISEYEKQRLARISENKARMEALGLSKMASSLKGSTSGLGKNRKGKSKEGEDDEDYTPNCDDVDARDDEDRQNDDDEEFLRKSRSGGRKRKVKNKSSKSTLKVCSEKNHSTLVYDEEDDDLRMAIALSLQDSIAKGPSTVPSKRKGVAEEPRSEKNYKKSQFTSRLQMTEDELILYFYQFDETGKGFISIRDLEKMATTHDFTWMDEELADMIRCFDSDGDGKLNLDDFQKIVRRCRMLKEPDAS